MREGDKWELTVPSELAYGDKAVGGKIKPGSVLIFELEILKVMEPSVFNIFGIDLKDPKILMFVGIIGFMIYQQYQSSAGGFKGPVVKLESASDPGNPRVFFDIEIGGEAAGRIE